MKLTHPQERGKRMALSNLALFGGAFFTRTKTSFNGLLQHRNADFRFP